VTIREASHEDLPNVLRLYAQLNPEDPRVTDGRDLAIFREISSSTRLILFVGLEADRVVTTCYLNITPNLSRNASPYGVIENVVTDVEFQNNGHGKAIVLHALHKAWQQGCYKVMLQTGSRREATHRFYESCGFRADDKFAFVARPA
jgi:GNAT superfamily N-acetyltransferase